MNVSRSEFELWASRVDADTLKRQILLQSREIKRLLRLLEAEREATECMRRQRDAALETVERLQWAARRGTAVDMAAVETLKAEV